MARPPDHLASAAEIVDALTAVGFEPILVGGMALVTLGSRRVTQDFDFVIAAPGDRVKDVIDVFYDRGLELIARFGPHGEVVATIDNPRVAAIRLRIDAPSSAHFYHSESALRVDLLFDFPVPAAELAARASSTAIRSHRLRVAAEADLLRLKKLARSQRSAPGDAEDIAFLESRLSDDRDA